MPAVYLVGHGLGGGVSVNKAGFDLDRDALNASNLSDEQAMVLRRKLRENGGRLVLLSCHSASGKE